MSQLLLYPTPRRCDLGGPGCTLADGFAVAGAPPGLVASVPDLEAHDAATGPVRLAIDPAQVGEAGDEAYHLAVDGSGVRIAARTATGLRWALATLVQLRRSQGTALPGLVIDDAPALRERGFMLDIARDRVPSMATLFALVDHMAGLKLNHLQLYNEHAFAYAGHEAVWRNADPVTPAEMRALDAYARQRGVALHANQNTLGHFERWLSRPAYAGLGEVAGPWLFAEWGHLWMEPNTLCPLDPRSLALVEDLLSQIAPCCSGAYLNINGDEPVDIGVGRSRDACARLGRDRVFTDYLGQALRLAQRLGKRPQFWCENNVTAEAAAALPRDSVILAHGYAGTANFANRLAAHAAVGHEVWVAPGNNNWDSYAGRTNRRRGSLATGAREGVAHAAVGLLNTEWGDQGHRQQWPLALLGLADGAQAAWGGGGGFIDRAAGLQALGSPELGGWLAALGTVDEHLVRGYGSATFNDGNCPWGNDAETETLPAWEGIAAATAGLEATLPAVGGLIEDECRLAVQMTRYAAERAVARRCGGGPEVRRAFNHRLAGLAHDYRQLWLARSRYGGLEDSYAKLRALAC